MPQPNESPRSFRDLRVWQEAVALAHAIFATADAMPAAYTFLADQLRRAVRSVPANIAEGNGRSSRRDYVRCLYIARGSLQEVEADVAMLGGTTILPKASVVQLDDQIRNVGRLLNALIRALGTT